MKSSKDPREIVILKRTSIGLSVIILLLVALLAYLIRERAEVYRPHPGGATASETGGETTARTGSGASGTDSGEPDPGTGDALPPDTQTDKAEPPVPASGATAESDPETEPDTSADAGQNGIWQAEMRVSVGLVFVTNPDGSCTVAGIGTCTDACLIIPPASPEGRTVTAIGERAFAGSDIPVTVYIPATVKEIGAQAFAGCPRLAYITAEAGQTACRTVDGVLYSRDMTRLLCCPPARNCDSLALPATLERIENGALLGAAGLRTINYAGDRESWARVYIGWGNNILSAVGVQCMAPAETS